VRKQWAEADQLAKAGELRAAQAILGRMLTGFEEHKAEESKAGGWIGTAIGAAIGTILFPGIGTAIGASLGSKAGEQTVGGMAVDRTNNYAAETYYRLGLLTEQLGDERTALQYYMKAFSMDGDHAQARAKLKALS